MTKTYWVVGGHYADTNFKDLVHGCELEEYGPFDTKKEAYDKWNSVSWRDVDTCCYRYQIVTKDVGEA